MIELVWRGLASNLLNAARVAAGTYNTLFSAELAHMAGFPTVMLSNLRSWIDLY